MSTRLTIVMYHYVRNLRRSRYPRLKALDLPAFRGQLDYFARHYTPVRMEAVLAHAHGVLADLPPRPLLLTFDDGYREHVEEVTPLLAERGMQGAFFPPAAAIERAEVLDVNKIQFILAAIDDPASLAGALLDRVDAESGRTELPSRDELVAAYGAPNRYDSGAVTLFKRLLQHGLPQHLRTTIVGELFAAVVTRDEAAFARELYVTEPELRQMIDAGMYVGSHGYSHCWLNTVNADRQQDEVERALRFLERIGAPTSAWVMCYPFGGHDQSVVEVVRSRGCALGLTTTVGIAELSPGALWTLPRLDTNDFPRDGDAPLAEWTRRVIEEQA